MKVVESYLGQDFGEKWSLTFSAKGYVYAWLGISHAQPSSKTLASALDLDQKTSFSSFTVPLAQQESLPIPERSEPSGPPDRVVLKYGNCRHTWISIFQPRASNIRILLVNDMLNIFQHLLDVVGIHNSRNAGTNRQDSYLSRVRSVQYDI